MELYNEENASPTITNIFELKRQEGILQGKKEGLMEGKKEGKIEGKIEGKMEERRDIARKLILQKMPMEFISNITELTMEDLEALKKEMQ